MSDREHNAGGRFRNHSVLWVLFFVWVALTIVLAVVVVKEAWQRGRMGTAYRSAVQIVCSESAR